MVLKRSALFTTIVSRMPSRLGDIIHFHRFLIALPVLRTQTQSMRWDKWYSCHWSLRFRGHSDLPSRKGTCTANIQKYLSSTAHINLWHTQPHAHTDRNNNHYKKKHPKHKHTHQTHSHTRNKPHISLHLLPIWAWAPTIAKSSSLLHGSLIISGLSWFLYLQG